MRSINSHSRFSLILGAGIALAAAMYLWGFLSPTEVRRKFSGVYNFLWNKWWFDELYDVLFVKPTHAISKVVMAFDSKILDGILHGIARGTRLLASIWDRLLDRSIIDGLANGIGRWTQRVGISLRNVQTGQLRQYVLFIVVGTVALFLMVSFF